MKHKTLEPKPAKEFTKYNPKQILMLKSLVTCGFLPDRQKKARPFLTHKQTQL